jgi:hypothetical protein
MLSSSFFKKGNILLIECLFELFIIFVNYLSEDLEVRWHKKREAEKFMKRYFQLLTFRVI